MSGSFNRPLANDGQVDALLQVSSSWKAVNYESVIAVSRYDKGQLTEIRLYPTDGRFDGPVSTLGIPRSSPPEIAARTLGRIQKLSTAFGTTVAIENNVGVIRVRASSTSQP
jgi:poly-gamma-glutamate synthesis protein (capsule biosynthesis protein)